MNFYVGQKVVCVGHPWKGWNRFRAMIFPCGPLPKIGTVYTIINLISYEDAIYAVELLELPSPRSKYWEAGFDPECFRPAVDRKTDISVFTAILADTSKEKEAAE